jgi:polyhydroxyalkanoate synthesis regulator phasin
MKTLFMTFALVFPLILMGQKASDISNLDDKTLWETFQSRIETAVENGDLTREEARKKYAGFRKRMGQRDNKASKNDKLSAEEKAMWETFQSRIETAVENGDLTREEARKKYAGFRKRMAKKRMAKSNKEKPNL